MPDLQNNIKSSQVCGIQPCELFFLLIFASVIIVMSLREIGERNVTEQQMNIIKCHLEKVPANDFQKDILLAPIWV